MYYSNFMNAVFLAPVVLYNGELSALSQRLAGGGEEVRVFVLGCAITGVFGFLLGVANLLSIKVTSPVTHMVSSVYSPLCILPRVLTISVPTGREKRPPDYPRSLFLQGGYHRVRITPLDGIHATILMQSSLFSGIVLVPSSLSLLALCFTHGFNPNAHHRQNMKQFNCPLHLVQISKREAKIKKFVSVSSWVGTLDRCGILLYVLGQLCMEYAKGLVQTIRQLQ